MVISRSSVILTKTGYKICEIGEIPEEWDLKPFGEILQIRKRKTSEKLEKLYTIPMDLIPENGTYCEYKAIESNEVIPPTYCEAGDILLPKITPSVENGKLGIVPNLPTGFALATSEVYPIVPGNTLTNLFTFYLLKMDLFRKPLINSMVGTTGRQRVPKDSLFNLMFPVPTITEQNKITDILSTADDAIHKVNEQIALTQQLKKGLMQKLLTRGISHTRFKKTEIGEIPEEWGCVELGDPRITVKARAGGTPLRSVKEYYENGTIPFVKIEDMVNSPKFIVKTTEFITEYGLRNSSSWLTPVDSILYSMYASYGKVSINKIPVATNQAILSLIPNESNVSVDFLYYELENKKDSLRPYLRTTTQDNLNANIVTKLCIALPPMAEQQKIAEILSTVDSKLELLRRKKEKLEVLKKGLMNHLLTGKVRVKV
ncbi:Type I restriction enzyme MjaXIP specificity protein [Thermoplasmatales archaeon]|nr:Type I restriction enzyme MjaXIP specificity protein [Thermoplasmatales archaeon]